MATYGILVCFLLILMCVIACIKCKSVASVISVCAIIALLVCAIILFAKTEVNTEKTIGTRTSETVSTTTEGHRVFLLF